MFFNSKITLHEVYFGKTPELQKIEKQLGIFRQKYLGRYLTNVHCNSDPDLLKFNRMMEDYFGFGCFTLHIINQPIANAHTYPIDTRLDVLNTNKHLVADKKGFKFNKDADYSALVCIYSGAIFNPEFTDEEVMGIIMHEVGHNFYAALDRNHGVLSNLFCIITLIASIYNAIIYLLMGNISKSSDEIKDILTSTNLYRKIVDKIGQQLRTNQHALVLIYDWFETFGNITATVQGGLFKLLDLISVGLMWPALGFLISLMKLRSPFSLVFLIWAYPNERLADNFCTMYGYGPAQAKALEKIQSRSITLPSKIEDVYNKIPIISNLYAINMSLGYIILETFDAHPNTMSRTKDQLDMLEREAMKEDLDPKMRKVILSDVKACKDQIKKITDTSDMLDKDILTHAYYKALYENCSSKRLKDLIYDEVNKFGVYDRTYEEKLKK